MSIENEIKKLSYDVLFRLIGELDITAAAGSGKEKAKTTHSLKWKENNVDYMLTDSDYGLTFEQMSKMSEGIMNLK